jgi:hypothetical protein
MERFCRRPFFSPIDEYPTARVQGYSNIAVEPHATVLPNGRAMDASQFRVGGDFAVKARLDSFIPLPEFKPWIGLQLQTLPTGAAFICGKPAPR